MLGLLLICTIFGLLFIVLKYLNDKAAHKRKIARSDAELYSRIAENLRSGCYENASKEYYETATNEWRAIRTLEALQTLSAYGRL